MVQGKLQKPIRGLRLFLAQKILNPLLTRLGYTIIADHYYQPIPSRKELLIYHGTERPLQSINWQIEEQIERVAKLLETYTDEFSNPNIISAWGYSHGKSQFERGDAEILYSLIREKKPKQIIEVGAGASTQIMMAALTQNFSETSERVKFVSIEPYPAPFLRQLSESTQHIADFDLLEKPVQQVDLSIFSSLQENDILFIDSSHVFKLGSDVEFEFLKVYPSLQEGVLVHIHDIFFPFDYPLEWNTKHFRFWNEQYFLETFLQFNTKFDVFASLSMVNHHDQGVFLKSIETYQRDRKPGSFWMRSVA